MKFKPRYDLSPVADRLLYVAKDYAINFMPISSTETRRRRGESGQFTVGVDTCNWSRDLRPANSSRLGDTFLVLVGRQPSSDSHQPGAGL